VERLDTLNSMSSGSGRFHLSNGAVCSRSSYACSRQFRGTTNLFAYWNSDRMVLSTYGAQEVDRGSAPYLVALVAELAGRASLPPRPMHVPSVLRHRNQSVAQHRFLHLCRIRRAGR
jgi:hypothetical protein